MKNRIIGTAIAADGHILGTPFRQVQLGNRTNAGTRSERRGHGIATSAHSPLGRTHKGAVARDKRAATKKRNQRRNKQ